MQNWKKFPRLILFLALLAGISAPTFVEESVSAAPLAAVLPGDVVISEFRFLGPAGGNDEFIELYNPKNVPVDITGLKIMGSNNAMGTSLRATLGSVTLQPGQYYLLVNSSASAGLLALQNATYGTGITPDGGVAITLNDETTIIDAAGLSAGSAYKEGTPLAPLGGTANQSYERKLGGASDSCQDVGDNSNDFQLINPSNPQNLSTPRRLCGVASDLSLTQIVSNATPTVGTNVIFTITVTNGGLNDATNVTVRDLLPAGLTYMSNDLGAAYNSGTGIWTVGTLANGLSATINITATVITGGAKTNLAEVWSSDQVDPDSTPGNSSTTEDDDALSTVTSPLVGAADLSLTQSVNNATPVFNDNVVFTITVSNALGGDDATGVQVRDVLPAGLTYVSDDGGGTYNVGTGIWSAGTVVNGTSKTLQLTARVTTSGAKINLAEVSQSNQADPDSTPGNAATTTEDDEASVTVTPSGGQADLSLALTWDKATPGVAGNVVLTITVNNAGPYDATNVEVKDLLPAGLSYVSDTGGGTYNRNSGIWQAGTVANGASKILKITARVGTSTTRTNDAEIWKSDQSDPDSTPGNDSTTEDDDASVTPEVADLSLTKTMSNVTPSVGQPVVFDIRVSNANTDDDATNVQVKDFLPSSFTYVSDNGGGAYNKTTGIWSVGTLASGANRTLTITTAVNSATLIINQAEVYQSDQIDPDSVPNNGSKTEDDDASAPSADLSLTHSVNNGNPDINSNIIFAITVTNAGAGGTTNVQVKSLLPSGLTYVSDTGGGTYNKTSGIWTVGTLANGASKTLNITAKVAANGIKTNWAEVWKSDESDPDSIPGNNSTTEDDDASATITSYRSIVISEVAWAGTGSTATLKNDEWIELYNPSNASINITGWTLRSTSGSLNITLSGTIASGGYFLLERDDNFTVSDITADQIYTGSLSDSGEVLTLLDSATNFIDTANGNGGPWPKGSASNYRTMERIGKSADSDTAWNTNTGNPKNGKNASSGVIWGTPKKANSQVTAPTPTRIPYFTPTPTPVPVFGRPVISEILARPGFDWNQDGKVDVFDEFIEIKNLGPVDINMKGWKLDDEANIGSDPFTLPDLILKPGQHVVFYGLDTNILLSDGGDTVRLINPSNKIYDAYTYSIAKVEDESICRLPDSNIFGDWFENCTPTPGTTNTREGVIPSMPEEGFESPVCDLPDTLPADFLIAECHGYGANIWSSFYWDKDGWQGDQYVPENMSKWESFVE